MSNAVWSGFFFREDAETPLIGGLHCTHKYLGNLSREDADEVERIISLFFKWTCPEQPNTWLFNRLAFWNIGTEDECTVLLAASTWFDPLAQLRESLDEFRKDDHDTYSPHVTVKNARRSPRAPIAVPVYASPVEYRLMRGDDKLRVWKFAE